MTTEDLPVRLEPAVVMNAADDPIGLYVGPLVVESDNSTYTGSGRVALEWFRSPTVRWYLNDFQPELPAFGPHTGKIALKIPDVPNPIRAQWTESNYSCGLEAKPPQASGFVENGQGRQWEGPLQSVVFHLTNFIPYLGKWTKHAGSASRSRATLIASGWRITLDGILPHDALRSSQRRRRGFAISHVGRIEREDAQSFSSGEATSLLDDLYWFFSFCCGRPTPAILPVGFDEKGREVWSEWGSWNASPNTEAGRNWYNDFSAEGLESVFPGFMRRVHDPLWSDASKLAVYWYLEAATIGNDSGLILTQSSFELLAWTLLVQDRKLITPREFGNKKMMTAAEKLRQLLKVIGIAPKIAASLQSLQALSIRRRWVDGPHALIGLRNAMVHPPRESTNRMGEVAAREYFEAYALSMWYLELCLLHLFDYKGKYSNRLVLRGFKGDDVETVPWAPAEST